MNKALVEASAGSLGALFACLVLFPLDVAKTKHQASTDKTEKKKTTLTIVKKIYDEEGIAGLFVGLGPKAAHTVLQNFFYFYWYAWLKALYEKTRGPLTTTANLSIGALAGAINMTITLPLDVVSTRIQTSDASTSTVELVHQLYKEDGLLSFWKGYIPSLVLVTNPSIFYTIFDRLKLRVARELSAMEAFVLAAIAKSIATIVTYPIIRAKVIMQAEKSKTSSGSMVQVLDRIWQQDGVAGFFQGCNAQLLNTVFKSALLLMTKEQIGQLTVRLLYPLQQRKS
ncbi:ADP/ATP carrier protein [Aphanomyces cochlioides]|nr:ADP/ATP carrier protein [Aphanomyces cochlioides]